jgi:glutaredoxin
MIHKQLVVYVRNASCPDVRRTREFLETHGVPHRLIDADEDDLAKERVRVWTGYLSFPTLVVTEENALEPYAPPLPLAPGQSPRDVDRGTMLTEASADRLEEFLRRHGFLAG